METKDSIYWEGLAECYNRGLVKNVGVWYVDNQMSYSEKIVSCFSNLTNFSIASLPLIVTTAQLSCKSAMTL